MALQNIGASNRDDAFYRYKMPKMVTKIEGRGNGIKTNLVNMVDVAKALGRPPAYTTKFFGCELGAQSKFDEKTGTCTVNGSHDTAKLAALLEIFINKYVQCYGCGNPETEILISKAQMISMKCAACGHVSDVDMRDKLTTFILKNPPEQKKGGKDKKAMRKAEKERLKQGEAIDEEQKKSKKESKKKKGDAVSKGSKKKSSSDEEEHSPPDEDVEANGDNDGVQWQTDTSAEAAKQRIKEQLTLATSEMVMLDVIDDEPKNNRGGKLEAKNASKSLVVVEAEIPSATEKPDDDSGLEILTGLNVHDKLVREFNEYIQKGCTADQLSDYVQSSSGLQEEVMTALFEALFQGVGKGFAKEATKKLSYLAKVVKDESSQLSLLSAIGAFCEHASADAVKEVALVLKVLYDGDILEEDFIIQWYDNGSAAGVEAKSSQMWKYIKPFVEWLRSAEAESEEN